MEALNSVTSGFVCGICSTFGTRVFSFSVSEACTPIVVRFRAKALLLWEVINKESYKEYISEQVKSKTIVIFLASLAIGEWSNSNNVDEYELHSMSYCNYLDFVDNETVLQYIDDERKKEEFWKLEERIIKKAIAFFIIKKEHNSSLINAKIVNEKYEEWALA